MRWILGGVLTGVVTSLLLVEVFCWNLDAVVREQVREVVRQELDWREQQVLRRRYYDGDTRVFVAAGIYVLIPPRPGGE